MTGAARARTVSALPTILDAALGTELGRRGVDASGPAWSARALALDPGAVTAVHRDHLRAGARVLTACTFRTTRRALAKAGWGRRRDELVRLALRCARAAIEGEGEGAAGARVVASVTSLEDCFRPDLVPEQRVVEAEHHEQARALREAGFEAALVETMSTRREAVAAVGAAVAAGLAAWCSFVTAAPGRLLSGELLGDAVRAAEDAGAAAVLVNCVPAAAAVPELEALVAAASVPAGIFPNVGHARPGEGPPGWRPDLVMAPDAFAARLLACREAGATLLGGCCGTHPEHLQALARALAG